MIGQNVCKVFGLCKSISVVDIALGKVFDAEKDGFNFSTEYNQVIKKYVINGKDVFLFREGKNANFSSNSCPSSSMGMIHSEVLICIKNILLGKYGEEWSFFGGGLEKGENSKEALLREIREELEFNISDWDIKYLGEIVHYIDDFDIEYHRFLYLINIPSDINIFNDKEGSGAYFFDINDLETLKFNTPINAELCQLRNNLNS